MTRLARTRFHFLFAVLVVIETLRGQAMPDLIVSALNTSSVVTDGQSLAISGNLAVTVRNIGGAAVGSQFRVVAFEDRNGNGRLDTPTEAILGSILRTSGVASGASDTFTIPLGGLVSFRGSPILVIADSENNVTEVNEGNNARSTSESGLFVQPTGPLNPVLKWRKSTFSAVSGSRNVTGTPCVIDLTGDGFPEIVFVTYPGGNTEYDNQGTLRAISGRDGTEVWANSTTALTAANSLACGDIDQDGRPEIVAIDPTSTLVAFEHDGTFKWRGPVIPRTSDPSRGGPSIADLDHDGQPEIVLGTTVVNSDGTLKWQGPPDFSDLSIVVDLDLDGNLEVVTGSAAYRSDGSVFYSSSLSAGAYAAAGNFDADQYPEIVVVKSKNLYLLEHTGIIKWGPIAIPGDQIGDPVFGGPPTVADFDGDGQPEIGVAGSNRYVVFETNGTIKWQAEIFDGSTFTGSSVFDFEGDGNAEVVYGDEYFLRIFRGTDGVELFRFQKSANTSSELPVIADVDGDGRAEIVAVANLNFGRGTDEGILVFGGGSNNWVGTRKLWNQHSYHITNINDDGTIPRFEQPNWLMPGLNNFRQNAYLRPEQAAFAPDLTSSLIQKNDSSFPTSVQLMARIGNGGAVVSPAVRVAFYRGDPGAGGTLLGTSQLTAPLQPGAFADVGITWIGPNAGLHSIVVVADDNGVGVGAVNEGDETNNKAGANVLLGIGPFPLVDSLISRFKDSSVDVLWTAVPGATGYNVYRRTGTGGPVLVKRAHTLTSYTDTGLTNGTPYYYLVRWLNAQGVESGDGTEASATPTRTPSAGNTPPTISSYPVVRARVGTLYSYQLRAGDPDVGDALTYALVSPPSGMTISATGLIQLTPTVSHAGYQNIAVRVQDRTGRFTMQTYRLFVETLIVDGPPVISSTPITRATSGELYAYQVVARDPENGLVSYALTVAPVGMTINANTGLIQWLSTRANVGTHAVTVRVSDVAGNAATQSFSVQVERGNKPPTFTSTPATTSRVGSAYVYAAAAIDPDGDALTFSLLAAPAGMSVNATTGLVQWTPTAAQLGPQGVSLRVRDAFGLIADQNFTVSVGPPNQAPSITSSPILTSQVGVLYSYQVQVSDPNLPQDSFTFALTTKPAGMVITSTTGLIQWVPPVGTENTNQSVTVTATDLGGLTATQSFTLRVNVAGGSLPTVTLLGPANGAELTQDAAVTGTVTDDNLRLWRVEYRPVGSPNWLTLSTGTTTVNAGALGNFPATLLANDVYRMRLYAEDPGGSVTSPEIEVQVNTQQLKMGDFTLRFEDLRIPGFTFPISILRKYDTKRPQIGDFGPGWTLGFSEVDVRVDVNYNVFLTLPDGRRVKFRYTPVCASATLGACILNVFNTAFTAEGGVYDKLENTDCPQVQGTVPNVTCDLVNIWQPRNWKLTTKEGFRYFISGNTITRMEDRSGNWINIAPTGVTSNTGRNVAFERNLQGLITRVRGTVAGDELNYEYDTQGRLVRFLDQTRAATQYFYEDSRFAHYLTKIVDPLGRQALRNVFNAEGRLVAQCDAAGNITTLVGCARFDSQPGTRLFTAINARGFKTELLLDTRGNVVSEKRFTDATNFLETIRTYDANDNLLTERDPGGNTKSSTFDARGNRLTQADPGGRTTTYTYNACDKVATERDPAGNTTTYTYDATCNLRFVRDALGGTTEYRYSAQGQRTHFVDPMGSTWIWAYNAQGLLTSLTDPFGKATTFSFNNDGDLLQRVDRIGRRIDFVYDSAHRLTTETWGNGRVTSFVYDTAGQLTNANDPDSRLTMAYDGQGRLQSVDNAGTPGAPRVLMSYGYDANGNVTRVQDSLGGSTDYSYDALDRLSRVTQSGTGVQEKRVDMVYDAASMLTEMRRFSNLAGTQGVANTLYSYDCGGCAGRVTAIRHRKASDNSVIHDLTFTRDPVGNITQMTDAEGTHGYTYDAIRRLRTATHQNPSLQPNESYTYDSVGNRITSHLSHSYSYSHQVAGKGNRLLQDSQFNYAYDDEGNLVRKTERSSGSYTDFEYNFRNRLTVAVQRTALGLDLSRSSYVFDSLDRRIRVTADGSTVYLLFDGPNPALKLGETGNILSRRLYDRVPDGIMADDTSGGSRWFLKDVIASTRHLIDNQSLVVGRFVYDSFGRPMLKSAAIPNDILFAGREGVDPVYFRSRVYDPQTGRFSREDPRMDFGYSYASNNPLAFVDQTGESAEDALVTIVGTALVAYLFVGEYDCYQKIFSGRGILPFEPFGPGTCDVLYNIFVQVAQTIRQIPDSFRIDPFRKR